MRGWRSVRRISGLGRISGLVGIFPTSHKFPVAAMSDRPLKIYKLWDGDGLAASTVRLLLISRPDSGSVVSWTGEGLRHYQGGNWKALCSYRRSYPWGLQNTSALRGHL
jgi:hypothetical protein